MTREGIDQFMLNKNKNENSSVLPSRQYIRLELKVFPLYYLALHFIREMGCFLNRLYKAE